MKFASQKLSFVVASAALVLAGCAKTPIRPMPSQTAPIGQGMAPLGPPIDTSPFSPGLPPGLSERSPWDQLGRNYTALEAQTIYFDYDSPAIKASEREKLKTAKDYLDKNPTHRLLLEGHCDWHGTAEYNLGLGDRRANAAKKYLVTLGVKADRIETLSKGSLEAVKNADDGTRAKDRRVNLVVVNPGAGSPKPL